MADINGVCVLWLQRVSNSVCQKQQQQQTKAFSQLWRHGNNVRRGQAVIYTGTSLAQAWMKLWRRKDINNAELLQVQEEKPEEVRTDT